MPTECFHQIPTLDTGFLLSSSSSVSGLTGQRQGQILSTPSSFIRVKDQTLCPQFEAMSLPSPDGSTSSLLSSEDSSASSSASRGGHHLHHQHQQQVHNHNSHQNQFGHLTQYYHNYPPSHPSYLPPNHPSHLIHHSSAMNPQSGALFHPQLLLPTPDHPHPRQHNHHLPSSEVIQSHYALMVNPNNATTTTTSSFNTTTNNNSVQHQQQQHSSSKPIKVCGVCGDRAKSYHFGGISCDSCKAFFRRSVQNDAYKNFNCPYEGQCEISIASRKCCQLCRFEKCLSIGMETTWVMTEEQRLQMLKSRLEKRQKTRSTSSSSTSNLIEPRSIEGPKLKLEFEPDLDTATKYLTKDEISTLEFVMNLYIKCCREIPFNVNLRRQRDSDNNPSRSRTEILDMFFTAIQQFALFAQRFPPFTEVLPEDQKVLLRAGVLELCFVRGAYLFDVETLSWPEQESRYFGHGPHLDASDVRRVVRSDLFEKHMRFIKLIKDIDIDECSTMLLCVIILLNPDRSGLQETTKISKQQESFLLLLRKFMAWRYGERLCSTFYPKLLLTLPELRELSEGHGDLTLSLNPSELEEVQRRFSPLKLDNLHDNLMDPQPDINWTLKSILQKRFSQMEDDITSCSESSERTPSE